MRRSTVLLLVAALLAVTAPAATASTPPGGATAATRALARASFAAYRHAPRASDRIPAALLTPVQRKRLGGAATRRIAAGPGWGVYVALERHGRAELLAVGEGIVVEGPPIVAALRQVLTSGSWITFTPRGGPRTTVALVPDGTVAARLFTGDDPAPSPLRVVGNAVVARTPGSATVGWRRAKGRWISVAVTGTQDGTPVTATLLDGSHVTLDLGGGVVRTIP